MNAEPAKRYLRIASVTYGVTAVAILVLTAQDVGNAILWLHAFSSSTGMLALSLAAVSIATSGPLALSVCVWRLAARVDRRWALHLLFIPCACGIVYLAAALLDFVDGRRETDEPASFALTAAFLLLGLTILVHAAALAVETTAASRRRRTQVR